MRLLSLNFTLFVSVVLNAISCVFPAKEHNRFSYEFDSNIIDFNLTIEAYAPKGLKVVVSHVDGLEHLTFYGKISSSYRKNQDIFAHDIIRSTDGQWILEDKKRTLNIGDTLHYWFFVQYKGFGHRFSELLYKVDNLSNKHSDTLFTGKTNGRKGRQRIEKQQQLECSNKTLILDNVNLTAASQTNINDRTEFALRERIKFLTEIIEELIDTINLGTHLRLTGTLPVQKNAAQVVRHVLREKLHLTNTIKYANYVNSRCIDFEVQSPISKLEILRHSKTKLINEKYKVINLKTITPNEQLSEHNEDNSDISINPRIQ